MLIAVARRDFGHPGGVMERDYWKAAGYDFRTSAE
jgi:hypothetical protein